MVTLLVPLLIHSSPAATPPKAESLLRTLKLQDNSQYDLIRGSKACQSGRLWVVEDDEDHDLQIMLGGGGALVTGIGVTKLERREDDSMVRESATVSEGHVVGERVITSKRATETYTIDVTVAGNELRYLLTKKIGGQVRSSTTCVLRRARGHG